jgi:hypothetical protein
MNARDRWIFAHELKSQQLLLLLYYDAHANGDLACFPSFSKAAADCRLARSYVIDTTLKVLCAPGGPMSVVTEPAERSAILAKAGAKDNCRANVYRINFSNGPREGLSNGPHHGLSRSNGPQEGLTEAEKMAALLAMCVPIKPVVGPQEGPTDNPDGPPEAPLMVLQTHADGPPDAPEMVLGEDPNLKTESKTEPSRAHGGARAREGAPLARTLTGAPGAPRAAEAGTQPPPEPAATNGSAPPKAPVLGAGNDTAPAHGMRRPGAPPDPFADWLDQGAPPNRALALAIARPKPIYAPPEVRKAARQALADRVAAVAAAAP